MYRRENGIDAIDEYSRRLVGALQALDVEAAYLPDGMDELYRGRSTATWVLLQYNPFRYGRWGFAPKLLLDVRRLRRGGTPLALMVHEAWLDITDWRTAAMGTWQRLQLRALTRQAGAVMTSTEAIAEMLGGGAIHVPVGANITPLPAASRDTRERLGIDRELVVSLFGRDHPSRALEYAEAAIGALAEVYGPRQLAVLNLGADAPAVAVPAGVEVVVSGTQAPSELSLRIAASDLMLLPLTDGVSTRRSTLMAGLAHGVPVLGLSGRNTDRVLLDAADAVVLTPVGDLGAFADAAVRLTRDKQHLHAVGEAGRRLYEQVFDWPVAAARVTAVLDDLVRGQSVAA